MAYKTLSFLLLGLLFNSPSHAEFKDPTKPASYSANQNIDSEQYHDLKLSTIWISKHSRRVTINGEKAKQGETILSDVKIIKIFNDAALIEQKGIRKKLYLLNAHIKLDKAASSQ